MAAAFGVRRLVAAFRLKKANEKRRELILLANSLILQRSRRGMFIELVA
jgi:hypothetical protein